MYISLVNLFSCSRHQMYISVVKLFSGSRHQMYISVVKLFSDSRHQMYISRVNLVSGSRHQMYISLVNLFSGFRHHIYISVLTCSVVLDIRCTSMYLSNRIGGVIEFFISTTYTTNIGSKATNKLIFLLIFWCLTPLSAIFHSIMATSFSGGRSRIIRREPPTIGK